MTNTNDVLLTLTAAVEEFWPSDKPGAVLLAPEIAAEIINFLHANGYEINDIPRAPRPILHDTVVADGTKGMERGR